MRRPFDIVFVRALIRAHTVSASEAAQSWVNLGASSAINFITARDTMGVADFGAVTGSITPAGIDGSNDTGAPSVIVTNISSPAFVLVNAAGAVFVNLPQYRQYRWAATTIVTGPIIYGVYVVGMAATTPVTQAI